MTGQASSSLADETSASSNAASRTSGASRITGVDPTDFAANVALTVFPSTTPAQRPKSVSLVEEGNWPNAVAASVFMAHPIRAPLLISNASGMPERTTSAVALLQPHGNRLKRSGNEARNGAPFLVIGKISTPSQGRAYWTGETDGAPQAASVEQFRNVLFRNEPRRVIVAPEKDGAFAVPAAAWSAYSGDQVLYTHSDALPKATIEALRKFPTKAYVLGPPSVISPSVVHELEKLAEGVKRVAGKTPAENAVALARYRDKGFGWGIKGPGRSFVIARSDEPLVAALASPLSASGLTGPLLLTESGEHLPKGVREYLREVAPRGKAAPNHVWIVGNNEVIGPGEQKEIEQLTTAKRKAGD